MSLKTPLSLLLLALPVVAQSNSIPGNDINVYKVSDSTVWGRTGPAYPNGTVGMSIGHSMSNCGSVDIPWDGEVGGVMLDQSVKIAFLMAREDADAGRMVQVSGKSFCKHSRVAYNFSFNPPCFPCQSGPSGHFNIGCYDVYSVFFNGSQSNLGPTTEIDPWLGTWEPTGSYFDIGHPGQSGYPRPADDRDDLSTSGFTSLTNRMNIAEQELAQPGTFYGQNQVVIVGEPLANRDDNLVSRQIAMNWNGSSWSSNENGFADQHGSVLERWTGATTSMGGNGNDDGRFLVAVKVTGPTNGMWHNEYAVRNVDNHRGGAAFRIPMCPTARVENFGFHDIDDNGLNDWTMSRTATDLEVLAGVDNPLDWNTFYNVWFDSDVAPTSGTFSIDAARPGPGALTVDVSTTVPGLLGNEYLGDGCGITVPAIYGNSAPTSPNLGYAVEIAVEPAGIVLVAFSAADVVGPLGGGCTIYADPNQLLVTAVRVANGSGQASFGLPIPAGQLPIDLTCQAFELVDNGAMLGFLEASNGIKIRVAGSGCP